jgi:hypothetical protein
MNIVLWAYEKSIKDNPNPIVRMATVIQALEKWAAGYEERNKLAYPVGVMVPKVAIGAIRGGRPFSPSNAVAGALRAGSLA